MCPHELSAMFGGLHLGDVAESDSSYQATLHVILRVVEEMVAEKKLVWVHGPKFRLTAGTWLTYARDRMDQALAD